MIVVAGRLGNAAMATIARAVAARGGACEVVATAPPDAAGDRRLLALARTGVGHAAVLRSSSEDLEPADLELALRYLPDGRVIVLVGSPELAPVAAHAAAWSGAALIVVTGAGEPPPDASLGESSLVIAAPARDRDGAFAGVVADLAVRLDRGEALPAAWSSTLSALGLESLSRVDETPALAAARPGSGRRSGRR